MMQTCRSSVVAATLLCGVAAAMAAATPEFPSQLAGHAVLAATITGAR
jgi:hypothetical protein